MTIHLYPFEPHGNHGGTLRLRMAVEASGDDSVVFHYDRCQGEWKGPLDLTELKDLAALRSPRDSTAQRTMRRRLFPSTLWEAGGRAVRSFNPERVLNGASRVVIHTSYISSLATQTAKYARATVVDVYDLVWRSHLIDATYGSIAARGIRRAYAATVRRRESASLMGADQLLVAGWSDLDSMRAWHSTAVWVPTAIPAPESNVSWPDDEMRVGLIGNFEHEPTRRSARELVESPRLRSSGVRIVLAGLGSEQMRMTPAEVLGEVRATREFYDRIHCVVVPVRSGAGMKVKLAEGILAGRLVITTPLGAAGYPPRLRRHFLVVSRIDELTRERLAHEIAEHDVASSRAAFKEFMWDQGVEKYHRALGRVR